MLPTIATGNVGSALAGEYEVANSLRFDDGSSDSLTKTFSSAGNRKIWTWSGWIKKQIQSSGNMNLFDANDNSSDRAGIILDNNQLRFFATGCDVKVSPLLRDVSAWYHIVVAVDTTQATDTNRIKFYINGEQITSYASATWYSQNTDGLINNNVEHGIGVDSLYNNQYFDGYMSEVCFIDGQQLTPTSFGEFDEDTGIWKPIDVSGLTFGTNGFYLDFENSSSLGADVSGNGNNFTVNNLTSIDQTTDTCTNNFCTMNPLDYGSGTTSNATFSNGNIIITGNTTDWRHAHGTIGVSQGKWYYEAKAIGVPDGDTAIYIGWCDPLLSTTYNVNNFNAAYNVYARTNGRIIFNTSNTDSYQLYADGDILGFALDLDNGKGYISRNGTYYNNNNTSSSPDTNNPDFTVTISSSGSGVLVPLGIGYNDGSVQFNFGSPPYSISSGNSDGNGYGNFEYSVPSGYYALNTKNLAEYG